MHSVHLVHSDWNNLKLLEGLRWYGVRCLLVIIHKSITICQLGADDQELSYEIINDSTDMVNLSIFQECNCIVVKLNEYVLKDDQTYDWKVPIKELISADYDCERLMINLDAYLSFKFSFTPICEDREISSSKVSSLSTSIPELSEYEDISFSFDLSDSSSILSPRIESKNLTTHFVNHTPGQDSLSNSGVGSPDPSPNPIPNTIPNPKSEPTNLNKSWKFSSGVVGLVPPTNVVDSNNDGSIVLGNSKNKSDAKSFRKSLPINSQKLFANLSKTNSSSNLAAQYNQDREQSPSNPPVRSTKNNQKFHRPRNVSGSSKVSNSGKTLRRSSSAGQLPAIPKKFTPMSDSNESDNDDNVTEPFKRPPSKSRGSRSSKQQDEYVVRTRSLFDSEYMLTVNVKQVRGIYASRVQRKKSLNKSSRANTIQLTEDQTKQHGTACVVNITNEDWRITPISLGNAPAWDYTCTIKFRECLNSSLRLYLFNANIKSPTDEVPNKLLSSLPTSSVSSASTTSSTLSSSNDNAGRLVIPFFYSETALYSIPPKKSSMWLKLNTILPPYYTPGKFLLSYKYTNKSTFVLTVKQSEFLLFPYTGEFQLYLDVNVSFESRADKLFDSIGCIDDSSTSVNPSIFSRYTKKQSPVMTIKADSHQSGNTISWNQTFEFENFVSSDDNFSPVVSKVIIRLWKVNKSSENDDIGLVVLEPWDLLVVSSDTMEKYFYLQPSPQVVRKQQELLDNPKNVELEEEDDEQSSTAIKIETEFKSQIVFIDTFYESFLHLFKESPHYLMSVLRKTCQRSDRNLVASSLLNITNYLGWTPQILHVLIDIEVSEAPNLDTLFRADTLSTKALDSYIKSSTVSYVTGFLKDILHKIYSSNCTCEIFQVNRMASGEKLSTNYTTLVSLLRELLDCIYSAVDGCPVLVRYMLSILQRETIKRFPEKKIAKYVAVSGFLFLRLIGLAIMNPYYFDILKVSDDSKIGKQALSNTAKVIQRIANMSQRKAPSTNQTDDYAQALDQFVVDEQEKMKQFIDNISNVPPESVKLLPIKDVSFPGTFNKISQDINNILQHLKENLHLVPKNSKLTSSGTIKFKSSSVSFADEVTTETTVLEEGESISEVQLDFVHPSEKLPQLIEMVDNYSFNYQNFLLNNQFSPTIQYSQEQISEIFTTLRNPKKGMKLSSITIRSKVIRNAFRGESILSWLVHNSPYSDGSEEKALEIINMLASFQYIYIVLRLSRSAPLVSSSTIGSATKITDAPLTVVRQNSTFKFDPKNIYRFQADTDRNILNMRRLYTLNPLPIFELLSLLFKNLADLLIDRDPTNEVKLIRKSKSFDIFRELTLQLQKVDVSTLNNEEKIAFFVNIYNLMLYHGYIIRSTKKNNNNNTLKTTFYDLVSYNIGGIKYSLNDIEHGILRCNKKNVKTGKKQFDDESIYRPDMINQIDLRALFALQTSFKPHPPTIYVPQMLNMQLNICTQHELAGSEFVNATTIKLSPIFKHFSSDFGNNIDILTFVCKHLSNTHPLKKYLNKVLFNNTKPTDQISVTITYLPDTRYDPFTIL
eukprot:TRINITY_DN823_c0_g1_i4.p1 TRINITY_DN823_c0_g1~~TRINITY_DN823_c0_g1_i4.p1  ORF type:complete len:1551 (+),score=316.84 TRINITY_DN823_c0_g1_i4:72-4724(+)